VHKWTGFRIERIRNTADFERAVRAENGNDGIAHGIVIKDTVVRPCVLRVYSGLHAQIAELTLAYVKGFRTRIACTETDVTAFFGERCSRRDADFVGFGVAFAGNTTSDVKVEAVELLLRDEVHYARDGICSIYGGCPAGDNLHSF